MNDPAKANWPGRTGLNTFTFDMRHGETGRSARRRAGQCPYPAWKGTRQAPRCPEPNQPDITPPWYDALGIPQKALLPPSPSPDDPFDMVIANGRRNPASGVIGFSGRQYSCDEFPPASWIEGGIGYAAPVYEGQGGRGNTFCAPIAFGCTDSGTAPQYRGTASEQNWQGLIHGDLKTFLGVWAALQGYPVTTQTGISFQFRTNTDPTALYAARVWHNDGTGQTDDRGPTTNFPRRGEQGPQILAEYVPNDDGTMVVILHDGEVIRRNETVLGRKRARRAVQMVSGNNVENILGGSYGNLTSVAPTTLVFPLTNADPNEDLIYRADRRSNVERTTESDSAASNGTESPEWYVPGLSFILDMFTANQTC